MIRWMGLIVLALVPAWVQAQDAAGSAALSVSEGWIRAAPPQAPVRAGYALLENTGRREVVIDAVRSEAFGAIEIHEMREVDGVMRMRRVPQLRIEPGARLALEPGGLHLMLFRPTAALAPDADVEIVLLSGETELAKARLVVRDPR